MNKSLISGIATAALVGSIGLVYAQTSQGTDTYSQPGATQADSSTLSTNSGTSPAGSMPSTQSSSTMDSSVNTPSADSNVTSEDTLAARADRN